MTCLVSATHWCLLPLWLRSSGRDLFHVIKPHLLPLCFIRVEPHLPSPSVCSLQNCVKLCFTPSFQYFYFFFFFGCIGRSRCWTTPFADDCPLKPAFVLPCLMAPDGKYATYHIFSDFPLFYVTMWGSFPKLYTSSSHVWPSNSIETTMVTWGIKYFRNPKNWYLRIV